MIDLLQMQHALAHDPCRRTDRAPLGAVPAGSHVRLVLRVEHCARPDIRCVFLEFASDPAVEGADVEGASREITWRQIPMSQCDEGYQAGIDVHGAARVIFYRFRVCTELSDVLYIKRSDDSSTAGMSCLPSVWIGGMDFSSGFQLTVYEPGFATPEWTHGATMYQVFPDRFFRGSARMSDSDASTLQAGVASHKARNWPIKVHEDWNEPPDWEEPYEPVDFYGGNLVGICNKLDYIKSLGADVIYLNPICESRSNHRYNTGDYKAVDPILGSWDDFKALAEAAKEAGIRIMLDTVLSHTGASSRYFNADGSYDSLGAAQSEDSPYRSWYDFTPGEFAPYRCWWNDPSLPEIEEHDPTWQSFVMGGGEGGEACSGDVSGRVDAVDVDAPVLRLWQDMGVQGLRLDVADEIPDDVLAKIRRSVKGADPDTAIIGEVWEDPTTKVSYGRRRTYSLGESLDSAMNYPLREQLIQFALGSRTAGQICTFLRLQKSNYPKPFYESLMNLLSSHDVERIRSVLAVGREFRDLGRAEQLEIVGGIDGEADWRASNMQRILAMFCYMLPGMPCLYYGDERGMQGGRDPFCRASFPWDGDRADCGADLTAYYQALGQFRSASLALRKGSAAFASYGDDVICIARLYAEGGDFEGMLCVINRSDSEVQVAVDLADDSNGLEAADIIALRLQSTKFPRLVFSTNSENMALEPHATLEDGIFIGEIGPAQADIYQISPGLGEPLGRGSGIVCHITSVPNDGMPGDLGKSSHDFIDVLSAAGIKYWQVLPINPVDEYGSPYAGLSAFAGNMELVCDEELREDEGFKDFAERNKGWLDPHAAYVSLKRRFNGEPWWKWPKEYRGWHPSLIDDPDIAEEFEAERIRQYEFDSQWRKLHDHANSKGMRFIGDMPFYVSADSADVWANRDFFSVGDDGSILEEGGVPPDQFATGGQAWGVPTYRWGAMEVNGYDWWVERLRRMFHLFDYVRIDHFLGFSAYYAIPAGGTPLDGEWKAGPGLALFKKARDELGALPVIAEDLGIVTPEVRQLLAQTAFPGMDVLQFFDGDPLFNWRPRYGRVVYTSTHDTPTLAGWAKERYCSNLEPAEAGARAREIAKKLSYKVLEAKAEVVMFPLQDVIRAGNEARMNTPGTIGGNWSWQATPEQLKEAQAFLHRIAAKRL